MLPPVDLAVVAALVAAATSLWRQGYVYFAALVALAATMLTWLSSGISRWRRKAARIDLPGFVRKPGSDVRCPYPDAWYAVCMTDEVPPGSVLPATVAGVDVVVWRATDGGPAIVFDAYCPHLGAHLGVGGTVESDGCLRCPFHGWKFDADGALTEVPGCAVGEKVSLPPGAGVRKWVSVEQNGLISVWVSSRTHTASGSTPGSSSLTHAPWYRVPALPQLAPGGGQWVLHGFTEHLVSTVLWDIPENGSDVAHLPALHAEFLVAALRPWFTHLWSATWTPRDRACDGSSPLPENHTSSVGPFVDIHITEDICCLGWKVPGTSVAVDILQAGPSQVYLHMRTPMGPILVCETVTPVEPMKQRVLHTLWTPWYVPRFLAKVVLWATVFQFDRDVPIWAHKRYQPTPVLSKADKGIPQYRRWTMQFFGPDSITYEQAVRKHSADKMGLPADAKKLDW